jgi:hypothetical protein
MAVEDFCLRRAQIQAAFSLSLAQFLVLQFQVFGCSTAQLGSTLRKLFRSYIVLCDIHLRLSFFLRNMGEGVDLVKVEFSNQIPFIHMQLSKGIFAKVKKKQVDFPKCSLQGPLLSWGPTS